MNRPMVADLRWGEGALRWKGSKEEALKYFTRGFPEGQKHLFKELRNQTLFHHLQTSLLLLYLSSVGHHCTVENACSIQS